MILGLTGSMAMGKSTTAAMFAEAGIRIWSADAAVARLYRPGAAGEAAIRAVCPAAAKEPGAGVDKQKLRQCLAADPGLLERVEQAIHPLVTRDRQAFVRTAAAGGADMVLVEVPLLYETGGERGVDAVAVVTAPARLQRERVLARGKMTERQFAALLERQLPDAEKRQRADFIIEADSMDKARAGVRDVLTTIRSGKW